MTPSLKLNIYKDRSADLHESVVYRPGQAILSHQHQIDTSKLVNEILVETKAACHLYSPAKRLYLRTAEGYLSANNIQSGLSEYGDAYLKRMALPQWGIQGTVVKFADENGYKLKPLESFGIGDWIGWNIPPEGHDPVGFRDKVKVKGITISENDETGALEYTLDLMTPCSSIKIKMNQKVERFTQFSGSDVLSTPSSSSDGYSESEVNQLLQNKANQIHRHLSLIWQMHPAPTLIKMANSSQSMQKGQDWNLNRTTGHFFLCRWTVKDRASCNGNFEPDEFKNHQSTALC